MGDIVSIRAQVIDEYGECARKKAEAEALLKPIKEEMDRLQAAIAGWYDEHPADQSAVAEGKLYTLQVGPKAKERTITKPTALFKRIRRMGLETTLAIYRALLGELDKHLTAQEQKRYITISQTGRRTIKAVPKASPALDEAA